MGGLHKNMCSGRVMGLSLSRLRFTSSHSLRLSCSDPIGGIDLFTGTTLSPHHSRQPLPIHTSKTGKQGSTSSPKTSRVLGPQHHSHGFTSTARPPSHLPQPTIMSRPSRGRKQAKKGVQLTIMVVGELIVSFHTIPLLTTRRIRHGPNDVCKHARGAVPLAPPSAVAPCRSRGPSLGPGHVSGSGSRKARSRGRACPD